MSNEVRRKKQKEALLLSLEKNPLVEFACKKVGVSRMTFYRWIKEDSIFAKAVEEKISLSRDKMVDFAESMLFKKIEEGHLGATTFYLRHNSPIYKPQKELPPEEESTHDAFIPSSFFRFHSLTPHRYSAPGVFLKALSCEFAYAKTKGSGAFIGGDSYLNEDTKEYVLQLHPILLQGQFDIDQICTWTDPLQKKLTKEMRKDFNNNDIHGPVVINAEKKDKISYEEEQTFVETKEEYSFMEVVFPQKKLSERLETLKILIKKGLIEFPPTGCEELMRDLNDFPNVEDTSLLEAFVVFAYGNMCVPKDCVPYIHNAYGREFAPTDPRTVIELRTEWEW